MTIWIEYALAENFAVDFTLLYLTVKTLRLPLCKARMSLSALTGAVFATVFPLIPLTGILSLLIRLAFGVLLCLAGIKAKGKFIFATIFFFFLYTFAYGGALLGIYGFLNVQYTENGFLLSQTPVGAVIACLPFFAILLLYFFGKLRSRFARRKLLYPCKITCGEKSVDTYGLLDTGNSLTFHGNPVCLLDGNMAKELGGDKLAADYMLVRTAAGDSVLKIFTAEIQIYFEDEKNILKRVYFALGPTPLGEKYGVILQPQLLKEENGIAERTVKEDLHVLEKKGRRD